MGSQQQGNVQTLGQIQAADAAPAQPPFDPNNPVMLAALCPQVCQQQVGNANDPTCIRGCVIAAGEGPQGAQQQNQINPALLQLLISTIGQ